MIATIHRIYSSSRRFDVIVCDQEDKVLKMCFVNLPDGQEALNVCEAAIANSNITPTVLTLKPKTSRGYEIEKAEAM